jgi:hypothetical protein
MMEAKPQLQELVADQRELLVYGDGDVQPFTVGELAGSALQEML